MHEPARFILGVLLVVVLVTVAASLAGWALAPARRTARGLQRRLGARPDAMAISPEQACGVGVSAHKQAVAILRFAGDPGLVYPLSAVRGVELILDGEVKARAFRGEGRRPLDRITPGETGRVTLRLSIDDPAEPEFEVDLCDPPTRRAPATTRSPP